jgi:hypothetical protein
MTMPRWLRVTSKTVNENSTTILSGLAVAGVVATVALAVRATPEAMNKIHDLRDKKTREWENTSGLEDLKGPTPVEIVQVSWVAYIPAAITGAATIACIIGANQIGVRRNAAVVGAYALADTAFREYKDEVLAQLGKNKELKVQEAVQQRRIDAKPVTDAQVIITAGGDQLCFDSLTGRYFHSDIEAIRRAENEVKRRILTDMYASHNEFYELIGLEGVIIGDELGWNIENIIELVFTSHLAADGRPCLAIGYTRLPRVDYGKF